MQKRQNFSKPEYKKLYDKNARIQNNCMTKTPEFGFANKVLEFFLKVIQLLESLPGFTTFSGKKLS